MEVIKQVQLHKALFVPGYGDLNQRTLNQQFFPGIVMKMHPLGVKVLLDRGARKMNCIIPAVMIEVIVLEEEEPKDAKTPKKA